MLKTCKRTEKPPKPNTNDATTNLKEKLTELWNNAEKNKEDK